MARRRVVRERDYQHRGDPVRAIAERAQAKLAGDIKDALRHLRSRVPVKRISGLIRLSKLKEAAAAVPLPHFGEVLKGPFTGIAEIWNDAADHGASKITADFKRAGKRVRYRPVSRRLRKAYNPDEPRDERGKWKESSRDRSRREFVEGRAGSVNRLTDRWRNIARGEERRQTNAARQRYFAPDRHERRILSTLPGAKFDEQGNLSNVDEMRAVRQARSVGKAIGDGFDFDMIDEDTQTALRDAQDQLIAELSDKARDTVESVISAGVGAGDSPDEIAANIRDTITLTRRQADAVANYRRMLEDLDQDALERELRNKEMDDDVQDAIDSGEFLPDDVIERLTGQYADNYLDYRADAIARTESLRSANSGLRDSYRQAADRGVFPSEAVRRFWQIATDERVCPICQSIVDNNPDGVGLDDDFQSDDGPVDDAPIHTSCRCTIEYRTDLDMLPDDDSEDEDTDMEAA